MNKLLVGLFFTAALAACSSAPKKDAAPVSEGKATPSAVAEAPASATKPAAPVPAPAPLPAPVKEPASGSDKMADAKPLPSAAADVEPLFPPKGKGGALGERSIYYDFDSYTVKEQYSSIVAAHSGFLSKHAKAHVVLQGNCDERGSREYNLALGSRRAEGVKSVMVTSGASADQIEAVSFGKEKPQDPGHDESAWAKNRRVDIVYQGE